MFEDENEDDECGGQSRYPVMPSLIALQQMKNRLHLAFLGKKLMKWTALATVKELRKMALEITEYFQHYGTDYAKAFMLLARSRYYYPNLNTIVVQNVGSEAACRVEIDYRSVAGVKVISIDLIEEPFDPNEHLGIEKGGTSISDAKKAWRDLLRLTILMLQEREGFETLHKAHHAANKKQNVLGKLVIPKIQNAIVYIKSELEEQEREETFRLKRFKQSKEKKTEAIKAKNKKDEESTCCGLCARNVEPPEEIPVPKKVPVKQEPSIKEEPKKKEEPTIKPEPIKKQEPIKKPEPIKKQEPIIKQEPNIIVKKESKLCGCTDPQPGFDQGTGKFVCPMCNLANGNGEINVVACKKCLPEVNEVKERADHLMAHINQVLTLSRFYNKTLSSMDTKQSGLSYADIKKALENINSICACPIENKKIEEDRSKGTCGCASCASKDIKSEQKENVSPDNKPQATDKKPDAPCMTKPSGGGSKDTTPELYMNDCCKNMLQAIDKKPDAPCLSVPSGDVSKGIKPDQTVNDCCKIKPPPPVIEKKPDAPSLPLPSGCLVCGSKDIKSEQAVIDKKPEAPCLPEASGCPMCGSKDVKSEQKENDCGCKNKPQAIDKKPDSGCPMCGSKDVKSEQKENDCGCKNKPQAMDKKPDSGCPMCGSKEVKSEQKGNDCGCNKKPQTMDKKPDSGCPMCGSKDVKSEQKGNDFGCMNKPQAIDKKPDSGCPMCGSKDVKSEQKGNDFGCKHKPPATDKKPDTPSVPKPPGCLMCASKDVKSEQKGNDFGCMNKSQAIDKKPDSGCPMCGSKDVKSEQKENDCGCKNKPQVTDKKPDSGCPMCGSKDVKSDQKVNDFGSKSKPPATDKKPDTPSLPKPPGCIMCASKDVNSEQKGNDLGSMNKPQAIDKKPNSGCPICGPKDVKSEQKENGCGCNKKQQAIDKKPDTPSGCPTCSSKDVKSEQKENDCGCNKKPQAIDKKPDAPSGCPTCGSKDIKSEQKVKGCDCNVKAKKKKTKSPSGCSTCGSKDVKSEQKENDCGCSKKSQAIDNRPDAPSGCPTCSSKDVKSEQKENDCGCNKKSEAIDEKPDAPSGCPTCGSKDIKSEKKVKGCDCNVKAKKKKTKAPSGCSTCGSKDVKSEQKENDCGCNKKPQAIDNKPDAPSGCPTCRPKDVKSEQKENDCGCKNKPETRDKKPDAPSGCPTCGSKEVKSEQIENGCGCKNKPQAIDKKPGAPSGCSTCGSKDVKSEQKVNDYGCRGKPQGIDKKPDDCCTSKPLEKKPVAKSDACCQNSQDTPEYASIQEICSCTKTPDTAKEKSCCDKAGISKSDYQTYNLCSVADTISDPCFQSASDLYQPAPPFFYLYSGPFVHSQTGLHPICNGNMIPQINTISKKCLCSNALYPDEFKQVSPICPYKSINNLASQQSSKELCTCESTETVQSLQVDPIPMTCKNIFQSYSPAASLPPANLPIMLAKRIAKASEPYLKETCLKNGDYPVRERCEDTTIAFKCLSNNSRPVLSKQSMLNACKSIEQQTSFSCISSSTLCSGNFTTNTSSQEIKKPPYFKKSTTYFADVPQGFLPLLSYTAEEASNTVTLSNPSICSDSAHLHSTKDNSVTKIDSALNKFTPKQFMCSSPNTRDGKSRSCDVSETSLITRSYGTTQANYYETDETPGCCIFSKDKCITDSLHDIAQKQSPFFPSHTQIVNSRLCSISASKLCDSPDPQSSRLVSSRRCGISGTQSISSILDCILLKQCISSTTQNNSIQKASSTLSAHTKDFSIYITMTPNDNSPYKRRLDRTGPSNNTFETAAKPNTVKDCSTFVTVAPKKMSSYMCEGRSLGVCEAINRTEFFKEITQNEQNCCELTLFNKNENCIFFTPYTREGKPGPCGLSLKCDGFLKKYINSRKERSSTYSVQCSANKQTVLSSSFTCKNGSVICDICEKNNIPLSWNRKGSVRLTFTREDMPGPCSISETEIPACSLNHTDFKQRTDARPVPYVREGIPGPCGLCELDNTKGSVENVRTDQLTNSVPYTREGMPGLYDISKSSYNIIPQQTIYQSGFSEINTTVSSNTLTCTHQRRTCDITGQIKIASLLCNKDLDQHKQVLPNARKGLSGLCDVPETSYITSSQKKTALLQPTNFAPYTREGIPGPCGLSKTNDKARQFMNLAHYTREGRAGPCEINKTNNDASQLLKSAPFTREGRTGPCDITKTNNNVNQFADLAPYMRESRAGSCDISKTNNDASQLSNPAPFTREGRAGPCDITKTNNNVNQFTDLPPYTREGRAGSYDISEINNDASQLLTSAPFTHEGRAGPCDITKTNNNVNQFADLTPYTREGRAGSCDISKTNNDASQLSNPAPFSREGRAGPCDITKTNNNVNQFTDPAPYTREGKAGPSDISKTNNNVKQFADPAPYTREGKAGPCEIAGINNDARQPMNPASYMREGRAGPCDISKVNSNLLHTNPDPRQFTCQERLGPCGIFETKNTASFLSKITSKYSSNYTSNILQHLEPCNMCVKNNITCSPCALEPRESSNLSYFTSDGDPEAICVSKSNPIAISLNNTALQHFSHNTPYTREGIPGICGVTETNFENSQNKTTLQSAYIESFTREGKPGPCGLSPHNSKNPLEYILPRQFTVPGPFTREGTAGPCDISKTYYTENKLSKIELKQSIHTASHAPDENPEPCERIYNICSKCARENTETIFGPYGVSGLNNIARSICNLVIKKSTHVTLHSQERTLGLSETTHIVCSTNNNDSEESKNLQTRKVGHRPCSIAMSSSIYNMSSKQCKRSTPFTRESKPGLCGVFETNRTAGSNCNEFMKEPNTNKSRNFSPYIIVDMPESCSFSERKNILNSLYNKTSKPYAHILPCTRVNEPKICSECNRNGIACSLCIIDPKESTNSTPYTREEIPGLCGVSETKNNTNPLGNREFQILKPYTREGVPGPCGISEKGLTYPRYKLYASYACQLKPGPWNILESPNTTDSSKLITSVHKPCNIESHSKLGQCRSSNKNEFNFCDTQSCLMYQFHTPCGTYTRDRPQYSAISATKDATTYVTAVACRNCDTSDKTITFDTSTPYSIRNHKAQVPRTCINVTRSLNAVPRFVCSSCRSHVKASVAPVMMLPSHVLPMASSAAPSRTCCCKSQISFVSKLEPGPNCDKSLYSVGSNKFCATCGRIASNKANLQTTSAPLLKSVTYTNCDKHASSHVPIYEPCSDCRKTNLYLSCASNPSIKSIAIGTCASRNRCISSKAASPPDSAIQTSCPFSQNTTVIISCPTCSKKKREKCVSHASILRTINKKSCSSLMSKDSKAFIDETKCGYFEIGKKKVTKIYRRKNPDGTVTDEKRVIVIKTEKKCPEKLEASEFEAGTLSDFIKTDTNRKRNKNKIDVPKFSRQSKSDTCCKGTNDPMTYPQIRYCISTQDCNNMAVNNNCLGQIHDFSKNDNCFVTSMNISNTVTHPCGAACINRLEDTDHGPKCDYPNKSSTKSSKLGCANCFPGIKSRSNCSIATSTPTGLVRADRLEDSDSGPKCACENKSSSKSTTPASLARPVPPTSVCCNDIQDTDSSPTCDCPDKLSTKPSALVQPTTPVCANRLQDTDSGPKCNCASKSIAKTPTPVCANRLQDTDSGPKCDCASKSTPKPPTPVCANRLQDTDSGPKCDCASKSTPKPPTLVCANRLQDTDSGPKCDCASKSTPKPPTPVCANRLQDTDSGPKCDCANKSTPKPPTPVCANRLQDTDSGPKCDCASKSTPKLPTPVCANRLQDTDSGPKSDFASKSTPKPPTPVCANRLQDTDSGPKCDCASKSTPKPPTPVCANRLQDTNSGPKCDCASKSTLKPPTPVCANRLQDTDSGPKCDCAKKSPPLPATVDQTTTHVCDNRLEDSDSGPKCNCAGKSTSKPITLVCANRLQDSDSGPKCNCADKSPPETTTPVQPTPVCANRLQDSDSGPKCDCARKSTPKPPIPVCANRLQDTDSGSKCDCKNKSNPKPPSPVCANREQDTDSGPKCVCANKSASLPASVDRPTTPVCANRLEDSDSGPKCSCSNKSSSLPTSVDQPTTPVCANRLEDSDSGPKCSCSNKSPSLSTPIDRSTTPVCSNRLEDSDSGPKCSCANKSLPLSTPIDRFTTPVCANRLEDSDSGPKCSCANKSPPLSTPIDRSTTPVCANRLEDTDSGPKCDCAKKLTCKPPISVSSKQSQTMVHPLKCSCDNESPPQSQDKEVCCSLQSKIGIMKHLTDVQENSVTDDREFGYVYIVPSKKTICNKVLRSEVPCSTTNIACCTPKSSYDANVPTSPKKIIGHSCPAKIVPKVCKNRCCSTSDTGKLSIFRGGSMLDALRQLFQSSNSRTQNRKNYDKNICKTCYSPLSNSNEGESLNTPLCISCKEKFIDESEQDYRLTNYSTEPGSPASKRSPSPFGQMSFSSANVDNCCPAMVSTVISTDSNDSLMCMRGENHFRNANSNDAATSMRVRDETYTRPIKKGKIEHACVPDVKDCASHTKN